MKDQHHTLQCLINRDYPILVRRNVDGFSVYVPSLGIVVSSATLDECHLMIEEKKSALFRSAVEGGFGDAMLTTPSHLPRRRAITRMVFVLSVLALLLLTILIPASYVVSKIEHLVPAFAESAMDVVQRRIKTMSDDDQRKLSGIATHMCPVIDEMVAARCRSLPSPGAQKPGGR